MFILSLLNDPIKTIGFLVGLLIAITVHEFMHALLANYLGDPTAKYQGRLTLNPVKHLDPIGTLFLLFVGFGWGRPVPINPNNFQNPRVGEFLTSIAGPLSNFALAFIFAIILRLLPTSSYSSFLSLIIYLNLVLCAFNLLPIPPLDGSKILWAIFPQIDIEAFERIGVQVLFGLVLISYLTNFSILGSIISPIISFLVKIIGIGNIMY